MGQAGELLDVALMAADAGALAITERGGSGGSVRFKSSSTDPVSEADEAAEAAIRAVLEEVRPEDAIVGEEGGLSTGSTGLRWVIDPLDGTVNYLYGIPQWCVSVAVEDELGPLAGVVVDPARSERFAATRGGGATLDGVAIASRPEWEWPGDDPLEGVLLATGFNYSARTRQLQGDVFSGLIPRVRDIRRGGSAALDLCWTAIGRVDAYIEHGTRVWDVAAGALICAEAGLDVRTLPGRADWPVGLVAARAGLADPLALAFGVEDRAPAWPGTPVP